MNHILVVGAGMAGAVHARVLADAGFTVRVIDQRPHVAGNCFDEVHPSGVRIHRYGPHLFHTNNMRVVDWLSRFTDWVPYEHRVVARLADGRHLPLPVNIATVNGVFGTNLSTAEDLESFLATKSQAPDNIENAEDHLNASIGPELTDLYFRPYTKKMWDLDLAQVDASVVRRVQVSATEDDRYFPRDSFQALPRDGYTAMVKAILDHPSIEVRLETRFTKDMLDDCLHCFNSMPIDVFFDQSLGELPYRSIRFHERSAALADAPAHVTINYTDAGPMTRETWWHNLPNHVVSGPSVAVGTIEEPCDYRDNDFQRFYPIKTPDNQHERLYGAYRELARQQPRLSFIGRCGTYQYLDMDQVVNQSLQHVHAWQTQHAAAMAD